MKHHHRLRQGLVLIDDFSPNGMAPRSGFTAAAAEKERDREKESGGEW
jgi:hypothetical protein